MLKILSYASLASILNEQPNKHDVIFIGRPWSDYEKVQNIVIAKAHDYLLLPFDDVLAKTVNFHDPQAMHVQAALDWSVGRKDIAISCCTGKSRSSALAYVINCNGSGSPQEATSILNKGHYPNKLIVRLGAEILLKPTMVDSIDEWYKS